MPRTYLPTTGAGLLDWSGNFSTKIAVDPPGLGLTADQAADYKTLQLDYAAKYAAATHPDTRGGATVLAKNLAKKALSAQSRVLAMAATRHPGVTDAQRYDLGLLVRDTEPTPVPPPSTMPVLNIVAAMGRRVKIKLRDVQGSRRAKPEGVIGATVMSSVGPEPPVNPKDWKFEGNTSKTVTDVEFGPEVPAGSQVWLCAFWFNRKSESGPACQPVTIRIAGSLGQAA